MKDSKKNRFAVFARLFGMAKPIRGWLLLSFVISICLVFCNVLSPKILGGLVQQLYDYWAGTFSGKSLFGSILKGIIPLSALYLGSCVFSYVNMRLLNNAVSRYFTCSIRTKISEKLKKLPIRFFDRTPVGEILRRLMDDVSNMGGSIHIIVESIFSFVLQITAIIIIMFFENRVLALAVLIITPLSMLLSAKISAGCERHFDDMFAESGKLNSLVEECYSNYATTKAYTWEDETIRRHDEINRRQQKSQQKATFIAAVTKPCIAFTDAMIYIIINLIGGMLILEGKASVGTVVTMVLFAKQISQPLEYIADIFGEIRRSASASERVFSLFDMEEEIPDSGSFGGEKVLGNVKFENVDFSYDEDKPLIKNLSLDIKHGQNVAIVGPTGAGKTTIVNLLMRFYDPISGKITIDGRDISEISRDEVRGIFGMVLQDTWLFNGTVAENVAYGKPDATREEIIEACDEAYCDHFIRTLPNGYDTVIGDDTTNISGGQKQLLTIARALLADHSLLILDEATSNVDTRTEILIQKAMDKLMAGKTCFVIAHRLSTIVDSDLIIVINEGKIVETGKHSELLDKKGFYYELYNSQYAV